MQDLLTAVPHPCKDPEQPASGELCPDCEDGELFAAHLVQADRIDQFRAGKTHPAEASDTRVVACPECWQFWPMGHL